MVNGTKPGHPDYTYDFVIVGSGFGGSVSALRLVEKGYSVLVLERGKRFRDQDFAKTSWDVSRYLWAPSLRWYGILQISPFQDVWVLHGAGVGGGSLGYAGVLMQPFQGAFESPAWNTPIRWEEVLECHYATARRMLGVAQNPRLWKPDEVMRGIASSLGMEDTHHPTDVGAYFSEPGMEGVEVPDPYFGGEGPPRIACNHCGGCMVGCRNNAKNTLVKNYLYLAEKWGAQVLPEAEVLDIRPVPTGSSGEARYEVAYRRTTAWLPHPLRTVRARSVILAAGALGTMRLLFRCRDETGSLRHLSNQLGAVVRTNSETLLGSTSRSNETDYSKGLAITSIFHADEVTTVEPVRYPAGSSLIRLLSGPYVDHEDKISMRLWKTLARIVLAPRDFFRTHILPGWAERTTIVLAMQTEDRILQMQLGRSPWTLFQKGLVSQPASDADRRVTTEIELGHYVLKEFARQTNGVPAVSINEGLFNIPITAHILGGCHIGGDAQEGVVNTRFEVHNYPGLYVVDGSIMPGNPGVNPSLSIAALAEYAMSAMPAKKGAAVRTPIGKVET